MDATSPPRKRSGRPSKIAPHQSNTEGASTSSLESGIQEVDVVTEASKSTPQSLDASVDEEITELHASRSPESEDPAYSGNSSLTGAAGECRRSSRKKVIKFDVRDLLNKNRKPHKIQIEARIDSNAPTAHLPKSIIDAAGGSAGSSTSAACAATADLTSKQKTFIEKSAIFRRFSISAEQQNKVVQPLRPPPVPNKTTKISLLGKATAACDIDAVMPAVNVGKIAQTTRLSRTQEIFNSMMKSKQNSSLIVAQMQSNASCSSSSTVSTLAANSTPPANKKSTCSVGKRKSVAKVISNSPPKATVNASTSSESTELKVGRAVLEVAIQKRRGRPPKSKVTEKSLSMSKVIVDINLRNFETETETCHKLKEDSEQISRSKLEHTQKLNLETDVDNAIQVAESSSQQLKLTPEKAKNWKEYKSCINESDNSKEQKSLVSAIDTKTISSVKLRDTKAKNPTETQAQLCFRQHLLEDIVLEISSSSSCSSAGLKSKPSDAFSHNQVDKSKFKSVGYANETKQRNFAVVSFLQEGSVLNDDVTAPEFIVASVEEIIPEVPDTKHCKETSAEVVSTCEKPEEVRRDSNDVKEPVEVKQIDEQSNEMILKSPLIRTKPAQEVSRLSSPTRRTLSSSESETNSDRSNKPYKQGDKLRVSLKRVTMPESPTASISFTTSSSRSSSEISTESTSSKSHAENTVPKVPSAKRSKRLQKKKKVAEQDEADSTNSEEAKELPLFEESKVSEVKIVNAAKSDKIIEIKEYSKLNQEMVTIPAKISEFVENKIDSEQPIEVVKEMIENAVKFTNLKVSDSSVKQAQVYSPAILSDSETGEKRKSMRLAKSVENVAEPSKTQDEEKEIFKHIEVMKPAQEPEKVLFKTFDNTNQDDGTMSEIVKADDDDVLSEKVQNFEKTETIEDVKKKLEETTRESDELSTNIQNVSVETSTLLDILRTVQSNKNAATNVEIVAEDPAICDEIVSCVANKSLTWPVLEIAPTVSNKLHDSRVTDSPSRSETDSPQTTRKATRRYERRSRRGEDTSHKTLEETFAEIAAQSSKAILELAAREEEIFAVSNMESSKASFCNESKDASTEDHVNKHLHEDLSKDDAVGLDILDTTTFVESLVPEVPDTSKINLVQELPKQSETTIELDESNQSFVDATQTEQNCIIKCDKALKDNPILEAEAKIELDESTESRPTERSPITTPTRRGRKPKNKPFAAKSPTTLNELSINLIPVTEHKTESLDKIDTRIEEIKSLTILKNEMTTESVDLEEISECFPKKTNIASKIVQSVLDIPTSNTEDHTQIMPPKKIACENVEAEKHLLNEDSSKEVPLKKNISVCGEDYSDSSNKNKDIQAVDSSEESKDQFIEHVTHIREGDKNRLSVESTSTIPTPKRGKIKQKSQDLTSDEGEESRSSVSSTTPIPTLKRGKNKEKLSDTMRSAEVNEEGEESLSSLRSPTVTPKRNKSKPKLKEVVTEQATTSKKRTIKLIEESKSKLEKPNPKSSDKREKEKPLSKKSDKKKFLELEDIAAVVEIGTKFEEKSAKKKRQKKLKEAFEAALSDNLENPENTLESKDFVTAEMLDQRTSIPERQSPIHILPMTPTEFDAKLEIIEPVYSDKSIVAIAEPEENPDPLKDIEKFIEDGVNLLKRGYKIDDDSVDEVIMKPTLPVIENTREEKCVTEQISDICNIPTSASTEMMSMDTFSTESLSETSKTPEHAYFETPADTPLATPTATPPPKSPISEVISDEISGVRRSHRIKQITKTPKALVGRGLVRDKERFSFKDDVETKSHYSLDDHLTDLAEVEAKNAKFLKDMEERLSNFQVIKENEYLCERVISREARKMICDCFLTSDEEVRGELGCGEDCLNRLLMIECGPDCNVKDRCTNKRFQIFLCSPCRVFRTEKKGFGIMADIEILPGEFIMEYVGEVINGDEFENRRILYSQDKNRHYYFMALRSDAIIDATIKGNISRFINHSCDPNAETQKWTVNGELRIGFFSRKSIMPGEEITFDYQYQRYGREAQRCYCESSNCRGWIGEEPNSDEGEQVDADSDEEEEETEMLAESLLDDDDDSDTESVTDAEEEVQKKLEIAAAEAKLTPISDEHKDMVAAADAAAVRDKKKKSSEGIDKVGEEQDECKETEEDSKSKFKKLLSKMAEKVAKKKQKQNEKKKRKRRPHSPGQESATAKARYLEDPDIEDEVNFLSSCGLKNQSDTLRLSRLMVRAKLVQTRLNLLQILRKGELPCRRLFLDYHGMRFLHGWMSEDGGDMNIRMALLETLASLPIANKTVLTDSKVYQAVRNWCGTAATSSTSVLTTISSSILSPSDDSSKESSTSSCNPPQATAVAGVTAAAEEEEEPSELQKLAAKLTASWDSLPEIFRIPKRERIEQMKEHEREADRQYAAAVEDGTNRSTSSSGSDRYQRDRFGRSLNLSRFVKPHSGSKEVRNITVMGSSLASGDPRRRLGLDSGSGQTALGDGNKLLSKEQRREMFAAKVARDEAEKRLAEERREFETKCRFFGLDPKKTRPTEVPFCVNPATGQWFSTERKPIQTPPSYAHVQVPIKPQSTDPSDYQLPSVVATLPPQWKYAITPQGKIYYYHVQLRIPQWEPPSSAQMYGSSSQGQTVGAADSDSESEGGADDSTDDDDEILIGMNQTQLKAYIEKKIEMRRQQRYNRLVDERCISPRREEDRVYNQLEVRKYKENKEKIRKRKEEIRRKRADALKYSMLNMCTLGSLDDSTTASGDLQAHRAGTSSTGSNAEEPTSALPIQDYLLSSDDDCGEEDIKAECNNSPLLDKIVQGDKIVDELDALTKRTLKRATLQSASSSSSLYRDLGGTQASTSAAAGISASTMEKNEHKRRKLEKKEKSKKSKDSNDSKYRKTKEKFRCEIAGIIVHHLKPYRKDSCFLGRIQSDDDFNHLARKLTHFVMIKELKYCESVGQTLVVTESVKNKSREFIKKYMAKYGDVYVRSTNDPEFKDIPFTL